MVKDFLSLEESIVGVKTRSFDGKVSYGKFKDTAKALQLNTQARKDSCGQSPESLQSAVKAMPGVGEKSPSGKSAVPGSTITGSVEQPDLADSKDNPSGARKPGADVQRGVGGNPTSSDISRRGGAVQLATELPSFHLQKSMGQGSRSRAPASDSAGNLTDRTGKLGEKDSEKSDLGVASNDARRDLVKTAIEAALSSPAGGLGTDSGSNTSISNISTAIHSLDLMALDKTELNAAPTVTEDPEVSLFVRVTKKYRRTMQFQQAIR